VQKLLVGVLKVWGGSLKRWLITGIYDQKGYSNKSSLHSTWCLKWLV